MTVESSARRTEGDRTAPAENDAFVPAAFHNLIGYHLRVAQEASFHAFAKAAGKADLKPGWYALLTVLAERESMTPSELSRICGRDRSTLTSSLKGLATRGLIERRSNPEDQRSYSVRLTEEGRSMQQRLHAIADAHDRRLDDIAGKDKALLIAVLGRIAAMLEA
ncbi:MarR family winged helix-turn-helix transcriptional regulator [Neorhizobium sp. DT-125]|uniref:MarR family winged helix-turn-helix transcriptional regulator n=1 Tax=Neorhizobium sp. DT-125 TaxID=3396163 RepID=UPI003F1DA92D